MIMPRSYATFNLKQLPLFCWAERQRIRALPLPARRIAIQLGLPPATARTVAELAFGGGR
jgi:hypothetical protein